jgi:ACS family hexuronate transporter-like MFS transporter
MSTGAPAAVASPTSHFRWTICALLFFATSINYIDRQVLSILAPELQRSIGWNEIDYGYIVTAFQGAYAVGLLLVGRLIDRIGTRRGFPLIMTVWSVAAMLHALAGSAFGFGIARALLGLGEAGNFPAAIKTVSEWFPKQERALATGIFNAGSNVGAIAAPLIVPWIALTWGWRWAFVATGGLGFGWLALWITLYRTPEENPHVRIAELAWIRRDSPNPASTPSWGQLLPLRNTWAIAFARFMTEPVWWFFLFWLPKLLSLQFGVTLAGMGPPLVVIYLVADVGSVGGGWASSFLIRLGWSVSSARRAAMLICALCVVPVCSAARTSHMWGAVGLIGLAAAAHQGWSANLYTMVSDLFPGQAVAAVVGITGLCGAIGGMLLSSTAGHLLQRTNDYQPLLLAAAAAYLIALAGIQLLAKPNRSTN